MAHRQWPPRNYGSRENPQRFKQQDFNTLRDWCLSHGKLFEDDVFPAGVHSVGQQLIRDSNIIVPKWKRPWVSVVGGPRFPSSRVDTYYVQSAVLSAWRVQSDNRDNPYPKTGSQSRRG
uniref:Uncharacterized protein n=1 Tax=Ornithorhynchus anatinus TaxID=9258 RepID=A0A6I8P8I3_ORNAN